MEKVSSRKRREISLTKDPSAASQSKTVKPKSKRSKRREILAARELEEEHRLTTLLFGGGTAPGVADWSSEPNEVETTTTLFEIDRTGHSEDASDGNGCTGDDQPHGRRAERGQKEDQELVEDSGPAWVDEDDTDLKVNLLGTSRLRKLRTSRTEEAAALSGVQLEQRLRQRYESTTQTTARTDWARIIDKKDKADESPSESEETPLQTSAPLLQSSTGQRLPANLINIIRCPDANQSDPNQSVVQAVHFHPEADPDRPLLLTAGLDKTLRFFQIGADKNEKIHGIHFPKLPIYSAAFLGGTGSVVVSGRRPFFYMYDTIAGKLDMVPKIIGREEKSLEKFTASPDGRTIAFYGNDGYVVLVDSHTKQWVADLKMNGSVRAVNFTPDGEHILGSGSDGDIYRWDLRTRRCIERFANEDGTIVSSLASSSRHLAVGAESGVVNLYSDQGSHRAGGLSRGRTPIKSILNLHTSADLVRFNGDGQILAISTRREKHGLKLLHVPSATVFSNWPTSKTPLNYVWSMDFSPESKFLAVGNDKGKCLLYQLMHYQD